jgi:glutamine amidotransferase
MGWNGIKIKRETGLFNGVEAEKGFYFLHSYYIECSDSADIIAETDYGKYFTSAVNHGNVYGVQFHPEKSHANGVLALQNFACMGGIKCSVPE